MITLNFCHKHEKKRGLSYWKLNCTILQNKDYKNKITSFWQKWQQRKQNYRDPTVWWDNGKKIIQGITKDFCTKLKETEKEHLHQLRMELLTLQTQNKEQRPNEDKHHRRRNRRDRKLPTQRHNGQK